MKCYLTQREHISVTNSDFITQLVKMSVTTNFYKDPIKEFYQILN